MAVPSTWCLVPTLGTRIRYQALYFFLSLLSIHFPPLLHTHNKHEQNVVTDLIENTVVSDTYPVYVVGSLELPAASRSGIRRKSLNPCADPALDFYGE